VEEQEFHKSYAAKCFNECWNLIEKENRSEAEDEEMRRLSEVSFWHWMQVEDHTQENVSVGYWQLARVYTITGRFRLAYYYADRCVEVSEAAALEPFYVGYGYEARARAYRLGGREEEAEAALDTAYEFAEQVADPDWKNPLVADLDQIREMLLG
jgi:hypothetical protein